MKNENEEEENKRVEKEEKRKWGESRKKQSGGGRNIRGVKFTQGESGEERENFEFKFCACCRASKRDKQSSRRDIRTMDWHALQNNIIIIFI